MGEKFRGEPKVDEGKVKKREIMRKGKDRSDIGTMNVCKKKKKRGKIGGLQQSGKGVRGKEYRREKRYPRRIRKVNKRKRKVAWKREMGNAIRKFAEKRTGGG